MLEGSALGWPSTAEVIADVAVTRWSGSGLSEGYLEKWRNMVDPVFEAGRRELQALSEGNAVVDGVAVMEKQEVREAVDVASAGEQKLMDVGLSIWGRFV